MSSFDHVLSITTTKANADERGLLKLGIAGTSEVQISIVNCLMLIEHRCCFSRLFLDIDVEFSIDVRC